MAETNTYKELLLYHEKERNVNNIGIVFESYQNFMDSRHPRHFL